MRVMRPLRRQLLGASLVLHYITLVTCAGILLQRKRSRIKRFGVRPMNRNRNVDGLFATLIKGMVDLEWDQDQFFKYTRMTKNQFSYLHNLIKLHIKKDPKKLHISTEQRLIMTLHYLSAGCSMQEIAWNYRIGKSTVHKIIKEVCEALWNILSPTQLPNLTERDFIRISREFYERWNIPNCIGAVDGKHVNIIAPKKSGSEFFNYKKSFSLILMACCDAFNRFTMVDIGAAGSNHDSSVFRQSGIGYSLMNNKLNIPPPKRLPKSDIVMNHFLVADAAFPLHPNIVRPYPGANLGEKKNICNYRISRARRTIESTFGILSQRWQILKKTINASVEVCQLVVQATVILHNFLQNQEKDIDPNERKYPTGFLDSIIENGELQLGASRTNSFNLKSVRRLGANNSTVFAKNQRDLLADYFVSPEGSIPWQEDYVTRGSLPT